MNCTFVRLHQLRTQSMHVFPSKDHVRQKCLPHTARTKPSRLPIGTASGIKPSTRDIRLHTKYAIHHTKTETSQQLAKARSCASRDLSLGGRHPCKMRSAWERVTRLWFLGDPTDPIRCETHFHHCCVHRQRDRSNPGSSDSKTALLIMLQISTALSTASRIQVHKSFGCQVTQLAVKPSEIRHV